MSKENRSFPLKGEKLLIALVNISHQLRDGFSGGHDVQSSQKILEMLLGNAKATDDEWKRTMREKKLEKKQKKRKE